MTPYGAVWSKAARNHALGLMRQGKTTGKWDWLQGAHDSLPAPEFHGNFNQSPYNSAEADALEIMDRLERQGHSRREIMCAALLALEGKELPVSDDAKLQEVLYELRQALDSRHVSYDDPAPAPSAPKVKRGLLNSVVSSIKRFTGK